MTDRILVNHLESEQDQVLIKTLETTNQRLTLNNDELKEEIGEINMN